MDRIQIWSCESLKGSYSTTENDYLILTVGVSDVIDYLCPIWHILLMKFGLFQHMYGSEVPGVSHQDQ